MSRSPYARPGTPRRRGPTTVVVCAATVVLAVAGCTVGSPDVPVRPPVVQPTGDLAEQLRTALLVADDLTADFRPTEPNIPDEATPTSDRPQCLALMNSLEVDPETAPGTVEVRAAFERPEYGELTQHVIRWYPQDQATERFRDAERTLRGCDRFELVYADGFTFVETLTPDVPEVSVPAGVAVFSLSVELTAVSGTTRGVTVLMQTGQRLGIVTFYFPDQGRTDWAVQIANLLAERLAAQ
ncbi:hypothetical protein [Solwaraspora sp. WMMA2101]|uniref:hypothetical protein n=1 Tax=Solwaraspora sp. WMMA2101 TaxID=3404124 RepID=UPI003B931ACF